MNYFSAQSLIISQCQQLLADDAVNCAVRAANGWRHALEQLQMVPAIFVWHQTDRIPSGATASRGNGRNQIVDQVWSLVVAVRNVSDAAGAAAQSNADPIIATLLKLQGWKPSAEHGHLYRAQSPYQSAYVNGYGVYPFAFQSRIYT